MIMLLRILRACKWAASLPISTKFLKRASIAIGLHRLKHVHVFDKGRLRPLI